MTVLIIEVILSYLILSYLILSYLILSYLILSYKTLLSASRSIDTAVYMHRRRPGAELGTRKNFADRDFLNDVFLGIFFIFTPKISDDRFLVIDRDFRIFRFFSKIFHIFAVC